MRFKLISCQAIELEVKACLGSCPNTIECEFVEKSAHNRPQAMRQLLQEKIDAAEGLGFDAVLLGYGLCGNGTQGLRARSLPLILPRAHDCATLFLGSRRRFEEVFRRAPSTPYSSTGYLASDGERAREGGVTGACPPLEELIRRYGPEDGQEIWDAMHPRGSGDGQQRMVWIAVPETEQTSCRRRCEALAQAQGRACVVEGGDLGLIRRLLAGLWDATEFLKVPPGASVEPAWDWDQVIRSSPTPVPLQEAP